MNICTVSFFGHRKIENISETEEKLFSVVTDIIKNHDYVKFLVGREGEFDLLASSVISKATAGNHNTYTVLVLPYMKAGYRDHKSNYLCCYNEIEICKESAMAYPKSAIQIRNKIMIDRSDIVVCCIQHKNGGAYRAVQYAENLNRHIINIGI